MNIETFQNEQDFIAASLDFITSLHPKTIALSGGNTPKNLYSALADSALSNTAEFFQVDERYVPSDHPDSNQKMIRETLFSGKKNPKNFHHFDTSLSIEKSLEKYSKELPKNFDLIILGIGEDGHTASLFPDSTNSIHTNLSTFIAPTALLAHTQVPPQSNAPIKDRLTLTFPMILSAKNILILLKNKPQILTELQHSTKTPKQFPALNLLPHPNLTLHHLQI